MRDEIIEDAYLVCQQICRNASTTFYSSFSTLGYEKRRAVHAVYALCRWVDDIVDGDEEPIVEYLTSNVTLLKWMISEGYGDPRTLARRIAEMEEWLLKPSLLQPDKNADYYEIIEINLNEIKEPLIACPNDPDDVKPLSAVAGTKIDEVFIGSCMTNIGHFRAAAQMLSQVESLPTRLWISPPTKMDEKQLMEEGVYSTFGKVGARMEMPGCSLCMGNQARIAAGSSCVSTSTRNFPNRLGDGANVFLASAELAAISSVLGHLPSPEEYLSYAGDLVNHTNNIYRYLNFHEVASYKEIADKAVIPAVSIVQLN